MKLFDILKKHQKAYKIYSVANGIAMPLNTVPDEIFSKGEFGDGLGIKSNDGIIYAPADATVIQVAETKHAIGLNIGDVDILIHVGIDTVSMGGNGFEAFVKENQKVKKGQKLLKADLDAIRKAGYSDVVVVVVTQSPEDRPYKIVKNSDNVTNDDVVIEF